MSAPRQPNDPANENTAGSPTQPDAAEEAEVQGYLMIFCSACMHSHNQLDPKCNLRCAHGSSYSMPPGTIPTTY